MPLPSFATTSATRGATAKMRSHVAVCPFFKPPHPETFFLFANRTDVDPNTQVTVFTPAFYAMYLYSYWDPVKDANLAFYPVGEWMASPSTPPPSPDEQLRVYLEEIGENLRSSMARAEEELGLKITYVFADAFLADVCRGIAEERGVDWSAVWMTSSVASLAAYFYGDDIRIKSGVSLPGNPCNQKQQKRSFSDVVELNFLYTQVKAYSKNGKLVILSLPWLQSTNDQEILLTSIPKCKIMDGTQETLTNSTFTSTHVKYKL